MGTTGSLGTTELESRLKTREEEAARVTGEPLRTMCLRKAKRLTPLSTPKARKKPPSRRSPKLPENSLQLKRRLRRNTRRKRRKKRRRKRKSKKQKSRHKRRRSRLKSNVFIT